MKVRLATKEDALHIIRAIQNKHMDYNTTADVKQDIALGRLYVAVEDDKILGSVAVVYKAHRGYYAIMRMCVYSKKSKGKGVASYLIDFVLALDLGDYGATPWNDNPVMIHIFVKRGFTYQYTFNENYDFYKKSA
jgi:GNAT superfamily N-acetyltransferase